jgi:hypothetical protein
MARRILLPGIFSPPLKKIFFHAGGQIVLEKVIPGKYYLTTINDPA